MIIPRTDNVYVAVTMAQPLQEFMQNRTQATTDLWTKSAWPASPPIGNVQTTSTIVIYYYTVQTLILILPSRRVWDWIKQGSQQAVKHPSINHTTS